MQYRGGQAIKILQLGSILDANLIDCEARIRVMFVASEAIYSQDNFMLAAATRPPRER
jgi:hypothetical protein